MSTHPTDAQQGAAYAALPDERAAFEAQFPVPGGVHWDGTEYVVKDSHVSSYRCNRFEGQWEAWKARASHVQAPASVLHLVNSAFAEIAMAFPKAFALHKVGIADTAVREALAAPAPPPECETEAEKRAFAFGWFKALESERMRAESVLEDAARYRFLRDGEWRDTDLEPFIRLQLNTLWDAKIDAARAAQEGGK